MWWDCEAKGKGSRKSIWNFHSSPFFCFAHIRTTIICQGKRGLVNDTQVVVVTTHMHDHFGGKRGGPRARCCKRFENSFVTNNLRHYRRCFQAQSLH
jgi:hypothetical protein